MFTQDMAIKRLHSCILGFFLMEAWSTFLVFPFEIYKKTKKQYHPCISGVVTEFEYSND